MRVAKLRRLLLTAALVFPLACTGQPEQKQDKVSPPKGTLHAVDLLPAELRHSRPAKDAKEQKAWDEAIFAYYRVDARVSKRGSATAAGGHAQHPPVLLDTPAKREYRTRLREMAKEEPTFAGDAVAEDIGCGTSCFSVGVVRPGTGETWFLQYLGSGNVFVRADYRRNSRVMHVMGNLGKDPSAERWYLLEPHALKLVYLEPMSEDCFAVSINPDLWSSAQCKFVADTAEPEPLLH